MTGGPRPYIIKKKQTAEEAISHLEETAKMHLHEMSDHIQKLQVKLSEAEQVTETLRVENDALKRHIRNLCSEGDGDFSYDQESNQWHEEPSPNQRSGSDFVILGLSAKPRPSWDEVQKAFRAAAKQHHPDQSGDEDVFKMVADAYDNLKKVYNKK